jgi:nitroimidazol reductase NimA-like FMN-containing flavoprotein (pyridoxamine 5'-phosphate oxidase superfamily)
MEFRPMRRHRQVIATEECVAILQSATSGVLGLMGDGGYPYTVPISHCYANGKLYFHSAVSGHKVDAIKNESKCSFCVIEKDDVKPAEYTTYFRSVIAFGKISIIENDDERLEILRLIGNRFNPNDREGLQKEIDKSFGQVLIIAMDIEHLSGKESIEIVREKETDANKDEIHLKKNVLNNKIIEDEDLLKKEAKKISDQLRPKWYNVILSLIIVLGIIATVVELYFKGSSIIEWLPNNDNYFKEFLIRPLLLILSILLMTYLNVCLLSLLFLSPWDKKYKKQFENNIYEWCKKHPNDKKIPYIKINSRN